MFTRHSAVTLLALVLLGVLARSGAAQSGPVYNPANGHWYQEFRNGGLTWLQARAAAAALSYAGYPGHLVTITSPEENQFILSQLPNTARGGNEYWIGLYQDRTAPDYSEPNGGWRWITGEPYSWNDWRGEPNNANGNEDVVVMRSTVGWNDLSYTDLQYGYVVEYEPGPLPAFATVAQFLLIPNSVIGGQSVTGQVMLSQFAVPGGVVVPLSSGNPAAAVVPATVTVPGGTTGVTFPVTTFPVASPTPVLLSAGGPGGAVTATLQVLPNSSPADNLLANGSFEAPVVASGLDITLGPGGLPGWQILKGTVNVNAAPLWQPAPGAGSQSLDLVGTPGAATIEQTFPTVPGQPYLFSGWISHNADNPVAPEGRANIFLNHQFFIQLFHRDPQTTHKDMRWVRFAYLFQATAPSTTLTLEDVTNTWDAGGGLFLDGLAVTPAGAPAASPGPLHLAILTNPVESGVTTTGQVTFDRPGPADVVVTLSSSNPGAAEVPATVTVPAGSASAPFPIASHILNADATVTVTARSAGGTAGAPLQLLVVAPQPGLPAGHLATPPVYDPANGHWYQDARGPGLTWESARAAAASLSYQGLPGHLATLTSREEADFLIRTFIQGRPFGFDWWLGGHQDRSAPDYREPDGGWRWVTGEPFGGYTNWQPGEPNNNGGSEDVLEITYIGGWNDLPNGSTLGGYFVEYEPPLPAPPTPPASTGDAPVYNPANGHWYQAVRIAGTVTWPQARSAAAALTYGGYPGHLATVTSADENQFVVSLVNRVPGGPYDWWLGGFQDPNAPDYREPDGGWRWITGEPWGYTNWKAGEPNDSPHNENALHISRFGLTWNDLPDSFPLSGYVVEYEPLPIAGSAALPGNLLINGSFEQPDVSGSPYFYGYAYGPDPQPGYPSYRGTSIPGWRITRGTIDVVKVHWPAIDGHQSIDLVGSPGAATIEQSFATEPGREYLFSGYISHNPDTPFGRADVFLNGQFFTQLVHLRPGPYWAHFVYRFRAAAATTTLTIADTHSDNPVRGTALDGLAVTPADIPITPSPTALSGLPGGLWARVSSPGQIEISWTDNSLNETGFTLSRQAGAGQAEKIAMVGPNVTRFVDQNVQPGVLYEYWVGSQNSSGSAGNAGPIAITLDPNTGQPGPPAAPSGLTATPAFAGLVNLTWAAGIPGATGIGIWRRTATSDWTRIADADPSGTAFSDRSVQPNTPYTYRIRAHTNTLVSAWTSEVTVRSLP